jgi:hypothetical protein
MRPASTAICHYDATRIFEAAEAALIRLGRSAGADTGHKRALDCLSYRPGPDAASPCSGDRETQCVNSRPKWEIESIRRGRR